MKVFLHLEEIAFTELTKFEPPTLCLKLVRRNYKVRVIFKREIIWLNECFFFRSKIAYLFIISFSYESLFCNSFFESSQSKISFSVEFIEPLKVIWSIYLIFDLST